MRVVIQDIGHSRVQRTIPVGHPLHPGYGADPVVEEFFCGRDGRVSDGEPGGGSGICRGLKRSGEALYATPDTLLFVVRREHAAAMRAFASPCEEESTSLRADDRRAGDGGHGEGRVGVNEVLLIGRLGGDVAVRNLNNGARVASLSVATTEENWVGQGGQRRTEWHRVVTFQPGLVDVLDRHARKGRLVCISGKLRSRRWRKEGEDSDRVSTEIHVVAGGRVRFLDNFS